MRELIWLLLCALALHPEDVDQAEARLRDEVRRAFLEGEVELATTDPDVAAVLRALDEKRVDMDFEDAELEDVVSYLREVLVLRESDAATVVEPSKENDRPDLCTLAPLGKNSRGCDELCHERSGVVFVRVPAEKPFLLAETEVTNAQFRRFANRRRYALGHDSGTLDGIDLNGDDLPVTSVTWYDVHGYLEWTGLRLPTEAEWGFAAGEGDRRFLWGDDWPPPKGAGNYADAALGRIGMEWAVESRCDDGIQLLGKAGASEANQYGVQDLGGNVWEWCARPFKPLDPFGPRADPSKRFEESHPTLRGGAWCELLPSVLGRGWRLSVKPSLRSPAVGFRVALDAP